MTEFLLAVVALAFVALDVAVWRFVAHVRAVFPVPDPDPAAVHRRPIQPRNAAEVVS